MTSNSQEPSSSSSSSAVMLVPSSTLVGREFETSISRSMGRELCCLSNENDILSGKAESFGSHKQITDYGCTSTASRSTIALFLYDSVVEWCNRSKSSTTAVPLTLNATVEAAMNGEQ